MNFNGIGPRLEAFAFYLHRQSKAENPETAISKLDIKILIDDIIQAKWFIEDMVDIIGSSWSARRRDFLRDKVFSMAGDHSRDEIACLISSVTREKYFFTKVEMCQTAMFPKLYEIPDDMCRLEAIKKKKLDDEEIPF